MPGMTDPTDAMVSFQEELSRGHLQLISGVLDPEIFVHADTPKPGVMRMSYAKLHGKKIKAFAMAVHTGQEHDGVPVLHLGMAVPPEFRGRGYAKDILAAAIAELARGFRNNPAFYVEGVVSVDNGPSNRVSALIISPNPTSITDSVSGLPALRYLRKLG